MCSLPRKPTHPRTGIDALDSPDEQAEPISCVDASLRLLGILEFASRIKLNWVTRPPPENITSVFQNYVAHLSPSHPR
jgi:hypothetical protein